jgi:hypothetical protein
MSQVVDSTPVMLDMKEIQELRKMRTNSEPSQKSGYSSTLAPAVAPEGSVRETAPECAEWVGISQMSAAAAERCKFFELSYGKEAVTVLQKLYKRYAVYWLY